MLPLTLMLAAVTPMQQLSEEYLRLLWKSSPMTASQAGYHSDGVDQKLDDLSLQGKDLRVAVVGSLRSQLKKIMPTTAEERADAALLQAALDLEWSDLSSLEFTRRCDLPLENLGSALFAMVARPYAPLERRAADVTARLRAVPRYLEQAKGVLRVDVEIFRDAAREDGEGVIDTLQHQLLPAFEKSPQAPVLAAAVADAVAAVRRYLAFVAEELPKKPKGSFRYGRDNYLRRFGPYLQTDQTPHQVETAARERLLEVQAEMAALAHKMVPAAPREPHAAIRAALALVSADHPAADQLLATVRQQLRQARSFVADKGLLSLPTQDNLQVIETPPFLRAQLGVAAFDGAPPLHPELGAFFYVTPFPKDWSKEKIEAKLREYNRSMLQVLTIHEAMPGHYVQFEHANRVVPESRRVLRWVLGAGAYIEGWAVYAQQMMIEAGYLDRNPRLALTNAKMELRSLANALLDIGLHAGTMSDEEAMRLMLDETFQERPEAEAKLRRAKLSVTQLCSYFVGSEAWRRLAKRHGGSLRAFHDAALDGGAVTLPTLLEAK